MKNNANILNNILKPLGVTVKQEEAVVTLSIEYGFKEYVWIPGMSGPELEKWWRRQHDFGNMIFTSHFDFLPGKFYLENSRCYEYGEGHSDYYVCNNKVGIIIDKLRASNLAYKCHFFCNDDSFLKTPSSRYIHHMGYWPANLAVERAIAEDLCNGVVIEDKFYKINFEFVGDELEPRDAKLRGIVVHDGIELIGFGNNKIEVMKDIQFMYKSYLALTGDPMETWTRWTSKDKQV